MNPDLIAALADQRTRADLDFAARRRACAPRPAGRRERSVSGSGRLRRRVGMALVEAGLRLLATSPAIPGR